MFLKRLFDISFSFLGLIILTPLFFFITILIILMMPGPVLFQQTRVGKDGNLFTIWKFRTMVKEQGIILNAFNPGDNSRITSLGKLLRKTKIDELPQLFNILYGTMSFVGPRPEVKKWTQVYPDKWVIVLSIKPGMTDIASIEFRNEEELLLQSSDPEDTYRNIILPRKLDLNIEYVNTRSFKGDIQIIFRTIKTIFFK